MLLQFCMWVENTPWGVAVRDTTWGYPFVQLIHFTGLSLFVGTIILLNLRLLGITKRRQSIGEVYSELSPVMWTGFCIALLGGFLLFSSAAGTFYYNPAFRVKMLVLIVALTWHLLVLAKVRASTEPASTPGWGKVAALLSFVLFITVATGAVLIPNY
jgi:hypothetical protein